MSAWLPTPRSNCLHPEPLTASRPAPARTGSKGSFIYKMITTTDPKVLGIMYLVTAFAFFLMVA